MKNIKRVLAIFIIVIIALGIFFVVKGSFNYGIDYKEVTELKFMLGEVIDMNEIQQIVDEAFNGKENKIEKIDYFDDSVNISVVDPSTEEIQTLLDKLNERYNQNNTMDNLSIVKVSNVTIGQIIKPYIFPFVLAIILISLYMAIRFKKSGIIKMFFLPIIVSIVILSIVLSIYSIFRIPISLYTLPIILFIILVILTGIVYKYENSEIYN